MSIPSAISRAELLKACCESREAVTIIGDEETHWGSFLHFDVDLTLEVLPGPDPSFVTSSVHAVCFGQPPRSSVLLGAVKHYDEGCRQLLLTSLSPIRRLERRRFRRLPVPVNSGMVVRICRGGQQLTPRHLDLSIGGVCIELPKDRVTELEVGSSVDVKLRLGHHVAELPAKVARQHKGSLGLAFVEPTPQSLQRIYELLERGTPRTQIS